MENKVGLAPIVKALAARDRAKGDLDSASLAKFFGLRFALNMGDANSKIIKAPDIPWSDYNIY